MRNSKHKSAEQQDSELRAYNRLRLYKQDKPYHERYYTLSVMAIIFGWLANFLSGITESTKVYAFFYGFLAPYPFADTATWVLVIICVALLEIFHRLISKSYFKDLVENDAHTKDMTPKLLVMVLTATFLTTLSFTGGFDLIRLSQEKPTPVVAQILDVTQINTSIGAIADSLNVDADEYRASRKWKNRLSTQDAEEWKIIQREKRDMQKLQAQALVNIGQINQEAQAQADSFNIQKQAVYERKVNQRGYGLGFVAIFAMLALYVCLWYDEEYKERKFSYFERKYGALDNVDDHSSPTLDQFNEDLLAPEQTTDGSAMPFNKKPPIPSHNHKSSPNGSEIENRHHTKPIGFYTEAQVLEMTTKPLDQPNDSVQPCTDVYRVYLDQHTIPHTYFKGGKEITVHYTMRMICARIGQYEREVQEAITRKMNSNVLQNRKNWLVYWKSKKVELANKHNEIDII